MIKENRNEIVKTIIRTDGEIYLPLVDQTLREAGHRVILLPHTTTEKELSLAVEEADLLLTCYSKITANVLRAGKKLKGIVKYGVGIDAIDINSAKELSIPVVNIPEYADETVAEGAFTLMLMAAKRMKSIQIQMQKVGWVWPEKEWLFSDLSKKIVGIIGLGHIGKCFARMASGFRMTIVAYDPNVSKEEMENYGVLKIDQLDNLLQISDFVSIHCTLNPTSRELIGKRELNLMKQTATLINVSRGEIIDEMALVEHMKKGGLAALALDVYGEEPLKHQGHMLSPFYEMDNVILSPHLTFFSHEALKRLEEDTLARCFEILKGDPTLIKSNDPRLRSQLHGVTLNF